MSQPTILDCLFSDDVAEMRTLAHEHQWATGPLGDMARYLICALDDRERCVRVMERAWRTSGSEATKEANRRRSRRVEFVGYNRQREKTRPIHAEPKRFRLRPMPNPISDAEVEAML